MLCNAVNLTFDLLTLNFYNTSVVMLFQKACHKETLYKICAKSNTPRLSYRRLSAFLRAILGGGSELTELSQGCVDLTSLNLFKTQCDHHSIALFFQNSDILLHF